MSLTLTANSADRSVSWTNSIAQFDEQYLIINYFSNNTPFIIRKSLSNTDTSASLNGLPKNQKYLILLEQCVHSSGLITQSNTAVMAALQVPLLPSITNISAVNNGLSISFTLAPLSPIPSYVGVVVSNGDAMTTFEKPFDATNSTIINNTNVYNVIVTSSDATNNGVINENNTSYEVSLFLQNDNGDSDLTPVQSSSTIHKPNPAILNSASASDSQVTLNWSPAMDNAYYTTTAITIYYQTNNTNLASVSVIDLTATSFIVQNLTNGNNYQFYVTYSNNDGEGDASNQLSATPFKSATAPQNIKGSGFWPGVGAKTVSIQFDAPSDLGGCTIDHYEVLESTDLTTILGTSISATPVVINLANDVWNAGDNHTYVVRAITLSPVGGLITGHSGSVSITLFTVPQPVTNVVAVGSDGKVALTWSTPTDFGGLSLDHYEVRNAGDNSILATTTNNYYTLTVTNGDTTQYAIVAFTTTPLNDTIGQSTLESSQTVASISDSGIPHKAPIIVSATPSGQVLNFVLDTTTGLPATNIVAFVVDTNGNSGFLQQGLQPGQNFIGFTNSFLNAPINDFMVFVSNSQNQFSNIVYKVDPLPAPAP
jgi:fibronectin type 3 domain-containing protein